MLYAYWIAYVFTAFILLSHYYWTHDQHECYKYGAFSLQVKMLKKCTFLCQLKIQDSTQPVRK